jgi:uncharacterized membrane protein
MSNLVLIFFIAFYFALANILDLNYYFYFILLLTKKKSDLTIVGTKVFLYFMHSKMIILLLRAKKIELAYKGCLDLLV